MALKKFLFFLSLITFLPGFSFGSAKADSLYNCALSESKNETQLECLTQFAWRIHQSDSSIKYYKLAIELAKELNNPKKLAQNYNRIGVVYRNIDLLEIALNYYGLALDVAVKNNLLLEQGFALNNIAQIYFYQNQFDPSLAYYRRAELIFIAENYQQGLGYTYSGYSAVHRRLKDYHTAIDYAYKSLEIRSNLNDSRGLPISYLNLADLHFENGSYLKALEFYLKVYELSSNQGDLIQIIVLSGLAKSYLMLENYTQSEHYALKAIEHNSKTKSNSHVVEAYSTLSKVYEKRGEYKKALDFSNLYSVYKDSIFEEKSKTKLASFEIQQKQKEIELLEENQQIQAQTARQQQLIFVGLGAITLIAVFAGLLVFNFYKKERKSNVLIRQQKEALQKQANQLNEVNRFKVKLFTIIAHDLRAPLSSLKGILQLLEDDATNEQEFKLLIPQFSKSLKDNFSLLEHLLSWTKSQLDGQTINFKSIDINQIVYNKVYLLEDLAKEKGVQIINNIPLNTIVFADEIMVGLVFHNLISNAIKFTSRGDQIQIKSEVLHTETKITVTDTGMGIKKENIDKLFSNNHFSTMGTNNEKGTGLGLKLCSDFIKSNNGNIWVESEYGKGTSIHFTLANA